MIILMYEYFVCMSIWMPHACNALNGQQRALDTVKLEFRWCYNELQVWPRLTSTLAARGLPSLDFCHPQPWTALCGERRSRGKIDGSKHRTLPWHSAPGPRQWDKTSTLQGLCLWMKPLDQSSHQAKIPALIRQNCIINPFVVSQPPTMKLVP